ncbi:hypothetical protein [Nocardia callitridis]|uniref:Uncharacterized protein n=1 Tax=Nocardia callitridis TaxID=648753 RepID=A0ABP9L1D4_9NOCA
MRRRLARAGTAGAQPHSVIATDLEVVTITDTTAILTWTTVAPDASGRLVPVDADAEVRLGPVDSPSTTVHADQHPNQTVRSDHHRAWTEAGRRMVIQRAVAIQYAGWRLGPAVANDQSHTVSIAPSLKAESAHCAVAEDQVRVAYTPSPTPPTRSLQDSAV